MYLPDLKFIKRKIILHCPNPMTKIKKTMQNLNRSLATILYIIVTNGPVVLKPLKRNINFTCQYMYDRDNEYA